MARRKKVLLTVEESYAELFHPEFDETGEMVLRYLGRSNLINESPFSGLSPDWFYQIEPHAPASITSKSRKELETILWIFIKSRAAELAAFAWDGPEGVLECVAEIEKAGLALMAVCDKQIRAIGYIWSRLGQVVPDGGRPFSHDEFYPYLSQFVAHAHRLREELEAEKRRTLQIQGKSAWLVFVYNIMGAYSGMGGQVTISKLSNPNARPSKFAQFAYTAMLQVPEKLRVHVSGEITTFSDALSKAKQEIKSFSPEVRNHS